MMRSGNAVSSHSGLIPSDTLYEKGGGLLWPIARKRNLISLRSAALISLPFLNVIWSTPRSTLLTYSQPKKLGQ